MEVNPGTGMCILSMVELRRHKFTQRNSFVVSFAVLPDNLRKASSTTIASA